METVAEQFTETLAAAGIQRIYAIVGDRLIAPDAIRSNCRSIPARRERFVPVEADHKA